MFVLIKINYDTGERTTKYFNKTNKLLIRTCNFILCFNYIDTMYKIFLVFFIYLLILFSHLV